MMLFVTCLGIAGMTAFSVADRTREVGIRRALGSSSGGAILYFVLEGGIVAAAGAVAGGLLAWPLSLALTRWVEAPRLPVAILGGAMLLVTLVSVLATVFPAWRAAAVEPEVATRTV